MGKVGFGELTLWMVTQQRPTPSQVRVFESVLVALADHGFTPTAIAARLTYLSAPDSLQGALAAGLLGGAPGSSGLPRTRASSWRRCWRARAACWESTQCPRTTRGSKDLSAHILRGGLDSGFDLAFSNELRIDHSVTCPIITLRPDADLPIVPIYTNIFAPPLPQPKRFVQLGQSIRDLVESWPSDKRVAIIGTGHLSLELGGPRQFGPHGPDPEFDRKAVEWIASGDIEKALGEVSLESLWEPGNATHGFMDFMLMMGVAGAGIKADYVDTLDLFHTMEAYFTWYPGARRPPRPPRRLRPPSLRSPA